MGLQVKKLGKQPIKHATIAVYGPPKGGKTTFGAKVARALGGLVVDIEKGTDFLPFHVDGVQPESWEELLAIPSEFGGKYPCIVIDTLDAAYDLLANYVEAQIGTDLEKAAYGKGFALARISIVDWIRALRKSFQLVVFLIHVKPGLEAGASTVDLPGKTGRAVLAECDAIGNISVQVIEGRLVYQVSFSPAAGNVGARIPALHNAVFPAEAEELLRRLNLATERPQELPVEEEEAPTVVAPTDPVELIEEVLDAPVEEEKSFPQFLQEKLADAMKKNEAIAAVVRLMVKIYNSSEISDPEREQMEQLGKEWAEIVASNKPWKAQEFYKQKLRPFLEELKKKVSPNGT